LEESLGGGGKKKKKTKKNTRGTVTGGAGLGKPCLGKRRAEEGTRKRFLRTYGKRNISLKMLQQIRRFLGSHAKERKGTCLTERGGVLLGKQIGDRHWK